MKNKIFISALPEGEIIELPKKKTSRTNKTQRNAVQGFERISAAINKLTAKKEYI